MAVATKKKLPASPPEEPPDHLTMRLFDPGMTILHRAGLGGLACTLRHIERAREVGALSDGDVPGSPWADEFSPPWDINPQSVTLRFGEAGGARDFLKKLFGVAFAIKDRLI